MCSAPRGYRSVDPEDLVKPEGMRGKDGTEMSATPLRETVVAAGQRTFTFVQFGPLPVISLRHVGSFRTLERTWRDLTGYTDACGLTRGAQLIGVVYDDPAHVPADLLRYDACVAVPGAGPDVLPRLPGGELPVRYETLGPVWAWRTTHHGPLDSLSDTYRRSLDSTAFQEQGVVAPCPRPPFYETYRSGLGTATADESWVDLHLPVP
ncbi:GyrI-like domain-containing protein [Streptomyces sp. NPDC087440]|uniref:AraC family transcriptional regulator n=1 Tax=Streptomyces sp. NPDC087440 TaxID=3365790 RepID=UPI003818E789